MRGQHRNLTFAVILPLAVLLVGCQLSVTGTTPEQIPDVAFTQAAQTIIAELTQNAPPATSQEMMVWTLTPTEEPLPATSTPVPTDTPLPTDTSLPTVTLPPTGTPTPTLSPTPTTPPELNFVLAFQDDFSSARYWPIETEGNVRLGYSAGGYVIENYVEKDVAWSVRGDQYADVRVEVVGSRVDGPLDGYYGVVCHFTNVSHYYLLAVGSDGWYGIAIKQSGKLVFLKEGRDTGVIYTGSAPNVVRADCVRGSLTLWANGTKLLRVEDSTYSAGAVGMIVGTRSDQGYVVVFDDFTVYVPE